MTQGKLVLLACLVLAPFASILADPPNSTIENVRSCHAGLLPSMGLDGLGLTVGGHSNRILLIPGRRGSPQQFGVYAYQGGTLTFYPISQNNASMETLGNATLYYLRLHVGTGSSARDIDFVLRNEVHHPHVTGWGNWNRFMGGTRPGETPVHVALTGGQNIPVTDAAAVATFVNSFRHAIIQRGSFSDGEGRQGAVTACLQNFPSGTGIGNAIIHANRTFTARGPSHVAGGDQVVRSTDESVASNQDTHL